MARKAERFFSRSSCCHELRPVAGAAEHQGAELHFLIVGHIADGGIQVAAIAWQLLGRYRQQQRGGCVLRIGAAAEGVKVDGGAAPQPAVKSSHWAT